MKQRRLVYLFSNLSKLKDRPEYTPQQAILLTKVHSFTTFDQTINLILRLNVDPKHGDQIVRGVCNIPHYFGKKKVIAVLTSQENIDQCSKADKLIDQQMLDDIKDGNLNFDKLICTTECMPILKPFARILGPRGLMPNPKLGTLVGQKELAQAIEDANSGQIDFRVDSGSNIHTKIGKVSMTDAQIYENMDHIVKAINDKRPQSVKGQYFTDGYISGSNTQSWKLTPTILDPKNRLYWLSIDQ